MDLRNFSKRIRLIANTVQENSDQLTRKVALAVDAAVVMATPVDTGRARSNWQVELNSTPSNVRDAYVPGTEQSTSGANASQAIEQGKTVIGGYKTGDVIHITNNLPYIGKLNEGYSAQAGSHFVEKAVHIGIQAVKNVKLTEKGGVK